MRKKVEIMRKQVCKSCSGLEVSVAYNCANDAKLG